MGKRKPPPLPEGSKEKLYVALKRARTKGQHQKVLCLWMRAALDVTSDRIALALGMGDSGLRRIQARWLRLREALFKRTREVRGACFLLFCRPL